MICGMKEIIKYKMIIAHLNNIKKNLKNKGWSIINIKNLNKLENLTTDFIKQLKVNILIKKEFQKYKINNIYDLREYAYKLDDSVVNSIRKTYLENFSFDSIKIYSDIIKSIFGKEILLQKFPQIQLHIPKRSSTKTLPHSEIMAGHSPYTYNIWIPFHDIEDNSGIFVIDDILSIKLADIELSKKVKSREKLLDEYKYFPKLKFGEAIIFNSFVYHGSVYHASKNARISIDIRIQKLNNPLFQKFNDFFSYVKIL